MRKIIQKADFDKPIWVVYTLYSEGEVIYIGMTGNFRSRMRSHRTTQPWWSEVEFAAVEEFPTKEQALDVEQSFIRRHKPRYNVAGTEPFWWEAAPSAPTHNRRSEAQNLTASDCHGILKWARGSVKPCTVTTT